jgi:hypothetical protein
MMQECDACGLIFGGGAVCPSCGSRISHEASVKEEGGKTAPSGELPGLDQLVTSMDGIQGVSLEPENKIAKTSLPFSIGGSSGGETSLPFGVGSPSRGIEEESLGDANEVVLEEVVVEEQSVLEVQEEVQVVQLNKPSEEVVLVARVISEVEEQPAPVSQDIPPVEDGPQIFQASSEVMDYGNAQFTTTGGTVDGVDQDVILHQEDIVYHDFENESLVSEVVVDFDSLVDPATNAVSFDPTVMGGAEPELMPARALAVTDLNDVALKEYAHIGFAALAQSDWKDAADCFRKICESMPSNSAALNNFGLSLLQQALLIQEERPSQYPADEPHFEASVLALRQAAKSSQSDVSIICNLATALSSCHRHDAAVKFYDVALSLDPEDISSMNGKAVSLIGLREFDEATQLLRHATTIAPDNAVVSGNLHRISPMG